ncbi:MAG: T9SS type A sorting domain-containing protein [Bacteroidetes bacterium]|nr:T9SS type A sorting domain-containing protein [Bacteroidota bacterium]
MKYSINIILICLLTGTVVGQDSAYTNGGIKDEIGYSFCTNGSDGYVLTGSSRSIGNGSEEMWVVNITDQGTLIWEKSFGGVHHDIPRSIERTVDGGYIIYGSRWDGGNYRQDGYLLKLNSSGNKIWAQYHGGTNVDDGIGMEETSDGGFILSGYTNSWGSLGDYHVIKTDLNGIEQWSTNIGSSVKDISFDVIETNEGDFLVAGLKSGFFEYSKFDFYEAHSDIMMYKLDVNGNEKWSKLYGGTQNELVAQTLESPDGGYYVIGSTQSLGAGSFDIYLMKLDTGGTIEWEKTYGGNGFDYGASIAISSDNYLFITGSSNVDTTNNTTDVMTIKTDLDGNEIWTVFSGGTGSEYGKCVRATPDGGCAVLGYTNSIGAGLNDFYFLKFSANGELILFSAKTTGLDDAEVNLFPNPTVDKINISINNNFLCTDFIYDLIDVSGRTVYHKEETASQVELDVTHLAPGVYFYRITSDCNTGVLSGKFIVH